MKLDYVFRRTTFQHELLDKYEFQPLLSIFVYEMSMAMAWDQYRKIFFNVFIQFFDILMVTGFGFVQCDDNR